MRRIVWAALAVAGAAAEAEALRHVDHSATLSHTTRFVFQTDTKFGKTCFLAVWTALAIWYPCHILRTKQDGTPK